METLGLMGIDQHGTHYSIEKHPRKELLDYLGFSSASKMCVDLKGGGHKHIGYVIGGLWIRVYRVCSWKEEK